MSKHTPSKAPLERHFKDRVCTDLLKLKNCYFLKTQEVGRRGVPDVLICLNGRFVALELKTDKTLKVPKNLDDYTLQDLTLKYIRERGRGIALKVAPKVWEEVYAQLQELDARMGVNG
jgi:hypothetical protein